MTPKPPKKLPENFERLMKDAGEYGVVVVSFGSNIQEAKYEVLEAMAMAFSKLKQTVIWKITGEDLIFFVTNVTFQFPQ